MRIVLGYAHGTVGDGCERQRNGVCSGSGAGLLVGIQIKNPHLPESRYLIRLDKSWYQPAMAQDQADTELRYPRPPITEAVIERRFAIQLTHQELENLRTEFERTYPAIQPMAELAIALPNDGSQPTMSQTHTGYRLVNNAGTAIILLTNLSIAYARLAPYPGWHEFGSEASNVFKVARDILGFRTLVRIGVRFVNRLDIPESLTETGRLGVHPLEDYLLVTPNYPEQVIPSINAFTLQCTFPLPQVESQGTINVASMTSPVPNHVSFIFDIDIGKMVNVPQKEDNITALLDSLRHEKNRIFEFCLTPKMKDLFK